MTSLDDLLPSRVARRPVRCAACLWWGPGQGYRCDFDGNTVTRATARTRDHPCPFFIPRDQHLQDLRDRVWSLLMEPLD